MGADRSQTVRLPTPMAHQLDVLTDPSRFKVLACGRRWGKTVLSTIALIAGHGPDRSLRGVLDGAQLWYICPSFPMASDTWRLLKHILFGVASDKKEQEMRLEVPGGGSITVKSADRPDSLRGAGLDGAVLDEAAFLSSQVWRQSIRPALADRQGWALFISTPNGPNWFREVYDAAATTPGWRAWQRPTSDNPLIPPEELAAARDTMGLRAFRQEHEAEFLEQAGAEFDASYFSADIWVEAPPPANDVRLVVLALDPSLGESERSDFAAHVWATLTRDGLIYVDADIERRDPMQTVEFGVAMCSVLHPDAYVVESNGFQKVLGAMFQQRERELNRILPLYLLRNAENKVTRIRAALTPHLAAKRFRFIRSRGTKLLVDQLQAFPLRGHHDDGPDALAMAVRMLCSLLANGADQAPEPLFITV